MRYEAGWRRFFAILIDSIVLFVIFWLIGLITGGAKGSSVSLNGGPALVNMVIDFAYFIVLEAQFGATVGKMVTGIKVVNADGSRLTWGGSVARNLMRLVDGFPYVIPYLLGAIVMWSSADKQRLGDKVAGTVVVPRQAEAAVFSTTS